MNILHDPNCFSIPINLSETGSDREAGRYSAHRLMEEPGVACAQAAHEIVHRELKLLWIFRGYDLIASLFCTSRPSGPVVSGIEVLLRDLFGGLIENRRPLLFRQSIWSW
jgi:hypothetical protein